MINIITLITGFIFLIINSNENSVLTEKIGKCEVGTENEGTLVARCNAAGINSIPQDLGGNIEVLDISNNSEMTLNKDDLKSYPNVWAFTMMNINVTSIPAGFFQYTKYLRMLNISNTRITDLKEIPSSLVVFNYSHCDLEYVDISQLENVEKVYLRACRNLKKVPNIPITAPLKVLDMKYCDLTEADYSQIAPFCLLTHFGFHSKALEIEQHVHRCCGLRRWSRLHSFEKIGYGPQQCFRNPIRYPNCSSLGIVFEENAVNAYADCLRALRKKLFFKVLFAVLGVVILIIIAVLAVHYYLVRSRAKADAAAKESDASSIEEAEAEPESVGSVQEDVSDQD